MATATQVESFCESCGTRYAFEPRRPRGRHLMRVGRLVGILADDADIDSSALVVSRDPFHGAFHFCLECRRFTCPSCWDAPAGFCRSCAMATGSGEVDAYEDLEPDPETEALLQSALASLMLLGTAEEWLRLEPPPAPRAEIWAAPPELVEAPEDELSPMIEAGLAVLGAKALAEQERAQAEAEQLRLAEELRLEEERLVAEQAEQLRVGQEAEQARLAWEADQYRLAQEAEYARQAAEAEQYRLAQEAEAEQYRLAQEAEVARQAAEAEHHRLALAAVALHAIATPDPVEPEQEPQPVEQQAQQEPQPVEQHAQAVEQEPHQAEQLPPAAWAAMAASLGPDVETSVAPEPLTDDLGTTVPDVAPIGAVNAPMPPVLLAPEAVATAEPVATAPPVAPVVAPVPPVGEWAVPPPTFETIVPAARALDTVVPAPPAPVAPPVSEPSPAPVPAVPPFGDQAQAPAAWGPPPAPPAMPQYVAPPPPPVAWQMTAPVNDPRGPWAPPPPPPGWTPNRMPMAAMALPPAPRGSRSGFAATPTVGPVKGGVRPCPRCDLPLSGQARFCRRCGLPQV